ncbi:hypothetical protein [Sediminibacillus halophilus]|uniref:Uncharacterized protein n=1 Tax=Sediminibacillus halophilus TaxID=482461 RepID=A0A1G9T4N9_9BACI|nr:hypothetical protein [Sediminibacillus halophilus]SDM42679.1 hypothetical protein SAMN05216244_2435 [Sediminibacillus halophilus]
MSLEKLLKRYYSGNFTWLQIEDAKKEEYKNSLKKEEEFVSLYEFGNELKMDFWHEDDEVNPLEGIIAFKNVMFFAEINRYGTKRFTEMEEQEKRTTIELIITNLDKLEMKPVGYEVKEEGIVLAWYRSPIMDPYTLFNRAITLE